jgi:hypothetical protein
MKILDSLNECRLTVRAFMREYSSLREEAEYSCCTAILKAWQWAALCQKVRRDRRNL